MWQWLVAGKISAVVTSLVGNESNGLSLGTLLKTGGFKATSLGVVFLVGVFLSRVLGPESYGVYIYAYTIAMLVGLPLHVGLTLLIVRSVAQYQQQERWAHIKGIKLWANKLVAGGSLLMSLTLFLYFTTLDNEVVRITHYLSLLIIPVVSLAAIRTAILRGFSKPIAAQIPEDLVRPCCWLLLLIFAIYLREITPQLAMGTFVAAGLFALLVGQIILNRHTPLAVNKAKANYDSRVWLKTMMPLTLIGGIQMLNSQLDVVMIGAMLSKREVGIYQIAAQVVLLIQFPLIVINYIVPPKFSAYFMSGDKKSIQVLILSTTKMIVLVSTPIALFFAFYGTNFINIVFGLAYSDAYTSLLILVGGVYIAALIGSVDFLLFMSGHEAVVAKGQIAALLINIVLNLLLIPLWGISGAALATSSTIIVLYIYMGVTVWKKEHIKPGIISLYQSKN